MTDRAPSRRVRFASFDRSARCAPFTRRMRLSAFLVVSVAAFIAASVGLSAGPALAAGDALEPPPIPTDAERLAFIEAHQAGFDAYRRALEEREIHDEYDVTHYDVALDLDIPAQVLTGAVEVQATAQVADLTSVELDLYTPMIVDAVTVNGAPASYTHPANIITVTLDRTYQPGETFTIAVDYHGTPSYALAPFRWNVHGDYVPMVCSYSEPYGAPAWWVCKDDPKDKATFTIHVTAPDTLSTVSNGYLASVVQNGNGTTTYNWVHDYPMSTYLFSIATTNFQSWTEVYTALDLTTMNVDYFAYPEDFADAQISWSNNIQMMEYYRTIFGEYPFLSEKYAIAEFQHSGAMEHQTATSMGVGFVLPSHQNDYVVAHELSHSWVGDMITMREWSHAWCKEGFATLCEALYFESLYGLGYYHSYMNSLNVMPYANMQLYNITPPLSAAIYYKGAWVLHMLRHVIGEGPFFDAIHAYTTNPDYRYDVADTEDMRREFEATSERDLTWFFDQWIYSPGYPQYQMFWAATPAGGGYDVRLDMAQVQTTGPIFKMPIDVRIQTAGGDVSFTVWDSLALQSFDFQVAAQPTNLLLDPDRWLLKQVTTSTDVAAAAPAPAAFLAQNEPNPFNPSTTIRFGVPVRGGATLRIYDASGRLVRELLDAVVDPGVHELRWDGRTADGREAPSGVYFQRLETTPWSATGRMVLVR